MGNRKRKNKFSILEQKDDVITLMDNDTLQSILLKTEELDDFLEKNNTILK